MSRSRILIVLVAITVVAIVYYSIPSDETEEAYMMNLVRERQEKDFFLRNSEDSPFGAERSSFKGLNYFEPDLKYRVRASLIPISPKRVVVLATSTHEEMRYLEYAHASFTLDGVECSLLILEVMDQPNRGALFLSFADNTSAGETYGAGRYLDVKKVQAATAIELDFNRAYNPYCAYVDNYSCPFPPAGNILKVAIPAGERTYK